MKMNKLLMVFGSSLLLNSAFAVDYINCTKGDYTLDLRVEKARIDYSYDGLALKSTEKGLSNNKKTNFTVKNNNKYSVFTEDEDLTIYQDKNSNLKKVKLKNYFGKKTFRKCSITKNKNKVFNKVGVFSKIDFKPQNSRANFVYDVYYYVPKNISTKTNVNTLVFMHGGGASTSDRAGSTRVVNMYKNDLMMLADRLGFILIMPSGSGLNWGGHLISYFKDLNETIRKDLPVNPNKIALAGHSMGAMGITRSAHWLADEYNFFMPLAGGIQDNYNIPKYLSTYFNTNYYHIQGLKDHFQIFVERSKKQKENIEALETMYGKKSGYGLEFYNGGHNYDFEILKKRLNEKFKSAKRNFYQKELYPLFYYRDEVIVDQWSNGNEYYLAPRSRYFWLKAIDYHSEKTVIDGRAKIIGNNINISLADGIKTLRVYLSSKLVDMDKAVKITVNGKVLANEIPVLKVDKTEENKDAAFKFESYIDVQI